MAGWGSYPRREELEWVPRELREVFDELDIEKTWEYVFKTFKVSKKWKGRFEKEFVNTPRIISKVDFFILFGKENLQGPLNKIFYRDDYHTWIKLLTFVVRDKIREKEKEAEAMWKEHGLNSRYKIHNPKY